MEYRLMCMSKPEHLLEPIVEGIETYMTFTDIEAATREADDINETSGACFVPVLVH